MKHVYIIGKNFSNFDRNSFEILFVHILGLPEKYFSIIDLKNDNIDKAIFNDNYIIFSDSQTKGKSSFVKALEAAIGKDEASSVLGQFPIIPKPSSFMSDEKLMNDTWNTIKQYINFDYISLVLENFDGAKTLSELIKQSEKFHKEHKMLYRLKLKDENICVISDDADFLPNEKCIKVSELIVIALAAMVFNVNSIEVVRYDASNSNN